MSLSIIYTRATKGINAPLVTVETHISRGMPQYSIVGLPETSVKESKDRVRSAILNSHLEHPRSRVTINLAPAELPKQGSRFDLPIALGMLAASKQIKLQDLASFEFVGELALTGELRPIKGVLPLVLAAKKNKKTLVMPAMNVKEAKLVKDAKIISANNLLEVVNHLNGDIGLELEIAETKMLDLNLSTDFNEVKGQALAKRALEIAAAGRHNALFIGPPGAGKTMLATRFKTILPQLSDKEAYEVAAVHSISKQGFNSKDFASIPFRSPHHSSSSAALVGGGRPPAPGEISLAHNGVLFLDELPEFSRQVIESLREPLESLEITISRASYQETYPANFQLIAAMNPCPCGYFGSSKKDCRCPDEKISKYFAKLSGPLLDRIDLHIEVQSLAYNDLFEFSNKSESSKIIRERVIKSRKLQIARQGKYNQELSTTEVRKYCDLSDEANAFLKTAMEKLNFSARVYYRVLRVSRSIADLSLLPDIKIEHLSEALALRCLDKPQN